MNFDIIRGPKVAKTDLGGFHCFSLPLKLIGVLFAARIKLIKSNEIVIVNLPRW